eukprot:3723811-Prymnesium_polylepis.1
MEIEEPDKAEPAVAEPEPKRWCEMSVFVLLFVLAGLAGAVATATTVTVFPYNSIAYSWLFGPLGLAGMLIALIGTCVVPCCRTLCCQTDLALRVLLGLAS